ncbi:unnamed protein product [Rotaria sordida]|uniref:Transposase n=1 Tax=Rotaria sordida TaxID=392033 RepID=A0A818YRD5_9BILA|nr:unnamed protein product [Rotaria sordida]
MTRDEREALSQRICNFYYDSANKSVKTTVNYFIKQNIPRRIIYYILNKYLKYGITKDRPRSGRRLKLSDKKLKDIVKSVNNRTGVSQRKIAKDSHVHHSTISRNLRRRTSIRIRKRRMAPKMNSEDQEKRAKRNCGKLYRKLLRGCDLILDDEKYFNLTGDNVNGNRFFYSTDPATAPTDIKFRKKKRAEERLNEKNVPFVIRKDNPPNVPQARPIETIWALLEQKTNLWRNSSNLNEYNSMSIFTLIVFVICYSMQNCHACANNRSCAGVS